jgi:hypothetical protein
VRVALGGVLCDFLSRDLPRWFGHWLMPASYDVYSTDKCRSGDLEHLLIAYILVGDFDMLLAVILGCTYQGRADN